MGTIIQSETPQAVFPVLGISNFPGVPLCHIFFFVVLPNVNVAALRVLFEQILSIVIDSISQQNEVISASITPMFYFYEDLIPQTKAIFMQLGFVEKTPQFYVFPQARLTLLLNQSD